MPNKATTLFISDLHLDASNTKITDTFIYFLEHIAPLADALYILGDFFEVYIGDDDHNAFLALIKNAVSTAAKNGLPIFIMHGNRDFMINDRFSLETGTTLISDPYPLALYGKKILLAHGDRLCTDDKKYQWFRRIVQSALIKKIFLSLPLSFRQRIAKDLRKESAKQNRYKSKEILDVTKEAVLETLQKHQAEILIHGHTHQPAIHDLPNGCKRVVLSAWHDGGHYLEVKSDGEMQLVDMPKV